MTESDGVSHVPWLFRPEQVNTGWRYGRNMELQENETGEWLHVLDAAVREPMNAMRKVRQSDEG